MSQLSLRQYSVITSALSLLEKLLSPLLAEDNQVTSPHSFDFSLLEWVTLYVSNMLDVMETSYDIPPKAKGYCLLFRVRFNPKELYVGKGGGSVLNLYFL